MFLSNSRCKDKQLNEELRMKNEEFAAAHENLSGVLDEITCGVRGLYDEGPPCGGPVCPFYPENVIIFLKPYGQFKLRIKNEE